MYMYITLVSAVQLSVCVTSLQCKGHHPREDVAQWEHLRCGSECLHNHHLIYNRADETSSAFGIATILVDEICFHTHYSSLEGATELKFAPFCSS